MRVKRQLLALVFLSLAISLSGCGGSGGNSPTATNSAPTHTPVPSPTPTSPPTTDELFPHKAVWHYANKRGYKYNMTIALGVTTRIPESGILAHPLNRDFTLDSACTVNPKLDVAIPAYWSAEAATVGFDTPISMRALFTDGGSGTPDGKYRGYGVAPFMGDNRIRVAQKFSDGPHCTTFSSTDMFGYAHSDGFSVRWTDPVPSGSVRTTPFFIVIKDYFSPATPQGDTVLLGWIVLKPLFGGDFTDNATVYRDADGSDSFGIYSNKGLTLNGRVVDPYAPTPTPPPTEAPTPTPTPPPTEAPTPTQTTSERATSTAVARAGDIRIGGTVVTTDDNNWLYKEPSFGSSWVAILNGGTRLSVLAGPVKESGRRYWQVEDNEGRKGWINESAIRPVAE